MEFRRVVGGRVVPRFIKLSGVSRIIRVYNVFGISIRISVDGRDILWI